MTFLSALILPLVLTFNEPSFNDLIKAMAQIESNNRHWVTGRNGERGILQVSKIAWRETTRRLGVKWRWAEAFDRKKNLRVGRAYFKWLLEQCQGSWEHAILAYNCGLSRVKNNRIPKKARRHLAKIKRILMKGGDKK